LSYTVNQVHVFHNGVRLVDGTDFTATNGNSITLTNAAQSGDEVVVISYAGYQVSDTVSASQGGTFSGDVTVEGSFTSHGIDDNATSTAMTLDNSGNLLVGTTAYTGNTTNSGGGIRSDGLVFGSVNGGSAAVLNRISTDGDIALFRKNGTTVGSIGVDGDRLLLSNPVNGGSVVLAGEDSGGTETRLAMTNTTGSEAFRPFNSYSDNKYDLGSDIRRFKNLYLSGGVYLGGTGSANYLDDYEEGTFGVYMVPTVSGTITLQTAYDTMSYTKIGRQVTVTGEVRVQSSSASGDDLFLLPFTPVNLTELAGRGGYRFLVYDNSSSSYVTRDGYLLPGYQFLRIAHTAASADEYRLTFTYFTS